MSCSRASRHGFYSKNFHTSAGLFNVANISSRHLTDIHSPTSMQSVFTSESLSPGVSLSCERARGRTLSSIPSASKIRHLSKKLRHHYGINRHGNKRLPIDDLFYILLSRQTTERNFKAAYSNLRRRWPRWDSLVEAPVSEIFHYVRVAGLGKQRAEELKSIARKLWGDFGKVTLSPLKTLSTYDAEAYLTSLPGVGKKTARCVLMYAFQRRVFPVDVHCFRALNRLGLIACEDPVRNHEDVIQEIVPPALRLTLHVTLVSLGRDVCHARKPQCHRCPIRGMCPTGATNVRSSLRGGDTQ
jgi:endonuclease III